jgi:hypothetical protein
MMRTAVVACLLSCAPASAADPKLSAKVEKVEVPAAVAEPVRKLLAAEALVVSRDDEVVMRVWFRSEIPAKATDEQVKNGLTYREIPETTVVGAVEFPRPFVDFRKQEIPAGAYTLRFAVQPDIGDHTGVAPHTEFCLLSPAATDKTADTMEVKALIEQSSKVLDGGHPAVLLLFPNGTKGDGPKVVSKGNGVCVVNVRRPVTAGDTKATLGFGITVAGVWKP